MSFQSLSNILKLVEKHPNWQSFRYYRQIVASWQAFVKGEMATNTRLLYVNRQILWVATSSSAWSQNLALGRYSLLQKMNTRLSEPLIDIRFSPAGWYNQSVFASPAIELKSPLSFRLNSPILDDNTSIKESELLESPRSDDPRQFFAHGVQRMKERSHSFPLCPRCHAPTPPEELQRWSLCAFCAPLSSIP